MSFNTFERKHAEGFYTDEDIEALYTLQQGECYFCGEELGAYGSKGAYHIDHLTPISKNGSNWPGNLALTCAVCNKRKHSQSATVLWSKLKKEKSVECVQDKIQRNRSNTTQKTALTKARKAERKESLNNLSQELELAISRNIIGYKYSMPEEIYVSVEQVSYYIDIRFNHSLLSIPAPTQKQLKDWTIKEVNVLATSLLSLEHLSGYLKNA